MNFVKKIKDVIKMNDIFYSSELLRYEKQNQFQTLTGGILSIAIWITIAVSFASMVFETFQMTSITSETMIEKLSDPPTTVMRTGPQSKFMFGIRITDLMSRIIDLNTPKRYFDIYFTDNSLSSGNLASFHNHILQKCTREHWQDFPKILEDYDTLMMDYWLCPPINTVFNLTGSYISSFSEIASFTVKNCNNYTNVHSVCATPDEIDQYFLSKTNFLFNFYFTNPILNPNKPDYIDYYLESNANSVFSKTLGSITQIFLSDYTIDSDNSIWPFVTSTLDSGTMLDGNILNKPFVIGPGSQYFVTITLFKSSSEYQITREVRKISSVFSFIGGFFGAITAALFIIKSYTESAFQFSLSNTLFNLSADEKENNTTSKQQSFHFFKFIGMKFYSMLKTFGLSTQWSRMNKIIDGQEQIKHHLDIVSLLRRIIVLQDLFTFVLEDYQLAGIKMQRNKSLEYAKQLRKKFSQQQQENQSENTKVYNLGESPINMYIQESALDQKSSNPIVIEKKQTLHLTSQNKVKSEIGDIQCIDLPHPNSIPAKFQQENQSTGKHHGQQITKQMEYLINLKMSAPENEISMKIWNKIPQNLKEQVPKYCSINST